MGFRTAVFVPCSTVSLTGGKLTDEEKLAYLKIRTAFIDHKKSVDIEIPVETADKLINILMFELYHNSDIKSILFQ